MAKVYVTQETQHDLRQAEAFGDVVFVTEKDFLSIPNSKRNVALSSDLFDMARQVTLDDWIVMVGSPYVSAVFTAMVGHRLAKLRLLRWSNRDNVYYPLELDLR